MDWTTIFTPVLQAVLPVFVATLVGYIIVLIRNEWAKLESIRPDLMDKIQEAALWAVGVVNQLKANGTIPNNEQAKTYAENLVSDFLKAKGVNIDLAPWYDLISHSIEKAIDDSKNTVTTISTASTVVSGENNTKDSVAITNSQLVENSNIVVPVSSSTVTTSTVSTSSDVAIEPVVTSEAVVPPVTVNNNGMISQG